MNQVERNPPKWLLSSIGQLIAAMQKHTACINASRARARTKVSRMKMKKVSYTMQVKLSSLPFSSSNG